MIDPKFVELMNLELDGVATPRQRDELHRYLETHADAKAYFDELGRTMRRLDSHPLQDPPSYLEPRILAALAHHPAPHAHASGAAHGFTGWLLETIAPPKWRFVSTFGLGLATGVFLLAAIQFGRSGAWDSSRAIDPSQVSGTMVPPPKDTERVGTIPVSVPEAGIGGAVDISRNGSDLVAAVSIDSPEPVEWVLKYDPGHDGAAPSFVLRVIQSDSVVFEGSVEPTGQ